MPLTSIQASVVTIATPISARSDRTLRNFALSRRFVCGRGRGQNKAENGVRDSRFLRCKSPRQPNLESETVQAGDLLRAGNVRRLSTKITQPSFFQDIPTRKRRESLVSQGYATSAVEGAVSGKRYSNTEGPAIHALQNTFDHRNATTRAWLVMRLSPLRAPSVLPPLRGAG